MGQAKGGLTCYLTYALRSICDLCSLTAPSALCAVLAEQAEQGFSITQDPIVTRMTVLYWRGIHDIHLKSPCIIDVYYFI